MGPDKGSPEYEWQAEQVRAFLRAVDASTREDEDQILELFVLDAAYSREAIMDGVGRWRTERRGAPADAPSGVTATGGELGPGRNT